MKNRLDKANKLLSMIRVILLSDIVWADEKMFTVEVAHNSQNHRQLLAPGNKASRECLVGAIVHSEDAEVKCMFRDDFFSCNGKIQQREVKAVLNEEQFEAHLAKTLTALERELTNSFHCRTADCPGWCEVADPNVNTFPCPVCRHTNCLTCSAVHEGRNCRQYQDQLELDSASDPAARKTREYLEEQAQRCNFGDVLQESLRDRFVAGIIDTPTQKKLLQEEGLTFEGALDIALSAESADNDLHNLKRSEDAHLSPQHLHAINNPCKHCEMFGDKEDYSRKIESALKVRAQKPDESIEFYIQDVLNLCRQLNPNISEEDRDVGDRQQDDTNLDRQSGSPAVLPTERYRETRKHDLKEWVAPGDTPKLRIKQNLHPQKAMICVFWDCEGTLYWEMLERNATVNKDLYIARRMLHKLSKPLFKSSNGKFYSSRDHMRGTTFDDEEDLKTWLNNFFDTRPGDFWRNGINKLVERWEETLALGFHRRVKAKTSLQDDDVPIGDTTTKPLFTPQEKGRKSTKDKFPRP
ncbi:RBCK1 [Cordylochernes scorpioides]|uniref:RBCK1 n=1 Tax=Cordylochernes scorpioides TaxID=51811 RepID=A0ABY6LT70_9ARAC|nr:RBCK1 [Cordylochernes scorpioides]